MFVTLTFDDGDKSHYTKFYPILKECNLRASFYIVTGRINNPFIMTWSQIRDLYESGNEIGSHTCTHQDLTTLSDHQLDFELGESRRILRPFGVETLAFPYGRYDGRVISFAKRYYVGARGILSVFDLQETKKEISRMALRTQDEEQKLRAINMEYASQTKTPLLYLPHSEFKNRLSPILDEKTGDNFCLLLIFHGVWMRIPVKRFLKYFRELTSQPLGISPMAKKFKERFILEKSALKYAMTNFEWLCRRLSAPSIDVITVSEAIRFLKMH